MNQALCALMAFKLRWACFSPSVWLPGVIGAACGALHQAVVGLAHFGIVKGRSDMEQLVHGRGEIVVLLLASLPQRP